MKLISYNSSESGGMLGGYSSTSISYTDDGRCKVVIANRINHSQPIERMTYYAEGLLEKLSEVCERYEVGSWKDLPELDMHVLDEASRSQSFLFENGPDVVLDNKKMYPQCAHEVFQEINRLIKESKSYGANVEITEEQPMLAMGMMAFQTSAASKVTDSSSKGSAAAKWANFCANCGTKFMVDQKFCSECGAARPRQ